VDKANKIYPKLLVSKKDQKLQIIPRISKLNQLIKCQIPSLSQPFLKIENKARPKQCTSKKISQKILTDTCKRSCRLKNKLKRNQRKSFFLKMNLLLVLESLSKKTVK